MELQYFNISCKNRLEILTNQFPKAPLKITKEGAPYLILKQSEEKLMLNTVKRSLCVPIDE